MFVSQRTCAHVCVKIMSQKSYTHHAGTRRLATLEHDLEEQANARPI